MKEIRNVKRKLQQIELPVLVLCMTFMMCTSSGYKVLQENNHKVIITKNENENENEDQNNNSKEKALVEEVAIKVNYIPSEEERMWAYKIAFAEAGLEDSMGQTLVINSAINNVREKGYNNLIEEFTEKGRYSSVKNGIPYVLDRDGYRPVTEADLSNELKQAVDKAFEKDYTEELLHNATIQAYREGRISTIGEEFYKGGATYFYNPKVISEGQLAMRNKDKVPVSVQYGNHVFYRYWAS